MDSDLKIKAFLLIASVNPMIAYFHDGYLLLSLLRYKRSSGDMDYHFTNAEASKTILSEAKKHDWNDQSGNKMQELQTQSYGFLQDYLLDVKLTTDPNWLENHLRPQMKKILKHVMKIFANTATGIQKKSFTSELYGIDLYLDENLKLWYYKTDPTPLLTSTTPARKEELMKLYTDYFDVIFSYLRSRMKRVIQFVNRIEKTLPKDYIMANSVILPELQKNKVEFAKLNKNYLEPEFALPSSNGFMLIVDDNVATKDATCE